MYNRRYAQRRKKREGEELKAVLESSKDVVWRRVDYPVLFDFSFSYNSVIPRNRKQSKNAAIKNSFTNARKKMTGNMINVPII